jgi:hypothetical protein
MHLGSERVQPQGQPRALEPVWPVTSTRRPRQNPASITTESYQPAATGTRQRSSSSSWPASCSSRTRLMRR